jgi:putative DNA primase/helicase
MNDVPPDISQLEPDEEAIRRFATRLYRYADPNSFVSLRAFPDQKGNAKPSFIEGCLAGSPYLVERIVDRARQAARQAKPHVFCVLPSTFKRERRATRADVANGLTLVAECDAHPRASLEKLTSLLGPPSFVIASGGIWTDPQTGATEDKRHGYWLLNEPTTEKEEHKRLATANRLIAKLAGADSTAGAIVHPLRCPGSWHRKAAPRLVRILEENDTELDLSEALERLHVATNTDEVDDARAEREEMGEATAELKDIESALKVIPNDNVDWDFWNLVGMATWRASTGKAFDAFDRWSRKSSKYDPDETRSRWEHYADSPPEEIGAGSLFHWAREADLNWRKPSDEAAARPREPWPNGSMEAPPRILPSPGKPMRVARVFEQFCCLRAGRSALLYWRGDWWQWLGPHWIELEDHAVLAMLYLFTERAIYINQEGERADWAPTHHKIGDLAKALSAILRIETRRDQPCWLDDRKLTTIVAVKNGLLEVNKGELLEHTPLYFNGVSVPFDYDPAAPEPENWLNFLEEILPGDRASQNVIGEWFGYVISGRTDLHKIFMLIGPTRGGKGVIARTLSGLIGERNIAGPSLHSLATDFGLQPLIGKPLAIIADARFSSHGAGVVVERLLSISGEDQLTINRKFRLQWTGRLSTRLHIISNELPRLGDASAAIVGRIVLVLLQHSWLGNEDHALEARLANEQPGILNGALAGLRRLTVENGNKFTHVPAAEEAIISMRDLASPVGAYVGERCDTGPTKSIGCDALYKDYRTWADESGHYKLPKQTFGRDLRAAVSGIRVTRPRGKGGRERQYEGIALATTASMGSTQESELKDPPFGEKKT